MSIGSKIIRIVLDPIHFCYGVYMGSGSKQFAFTRDQIHLDPIRIHENALIGKKPMAPYFILVVCRSAFCIISQSKNISELFVRTEEEMALLLKVILDYKTKIMSAQDWETMRSNLHTGREIG